MMVMILVSVFWGLVSASIYVLGFTMVRDMFDQQRSGTYLGIFGSMVSLGMLIGPFLAGFLMDNFGWRPPLLLAGGLMAVAALLVFFGAKITKQEAAPLAVNTGRFDLVGALLVSVFLACLIVALSMTSFFPLGSTVSNILFTVAAVCLVGFVVDIAKKKDAAFVPVKVFRDRNSVVFSVCNFLASFSVMSVTVFIPAFIRASMTQDPIVMAIGISLASLLPQALQAVIGLALGAVLGKAIAKSGNARGVLTLGTIVRLLVYVGLLLTLWGVFGPANYIVICVFAFLLGIAIIQQSVTYSAGPQLQIGQDLRVQSNSIIQLGQNLGAGVAVPVYTMCIAFATAPFVQQGVDQQAASAMGIVNALPVMLIIGIVAIVVLLFVGLMLRPLPAKGEHGSDE
jgi:hypothetical protein